MTSVFRINFLISILLAQWKIAFSTKTEKNLLSDLTTSYNLHVRPASRPLEPVVVKFDLRLTKIVELNIKEQLFVINGRILMRWTDDDLKWNKTAYSGVDRLVAPSSLFWTPDILLYNTAHDESVSGSDVYKANLQIDENGTVTWMSPVTLKASCDIQIKWFPFDSQSCSLLFGSISMTSKKLKLQFYNRPGSVTAFRDKFHYTSGVWRLKTLSSQLRNEVYACCPNAFSLIEFTIAVERIPMNYVLYLVLPCLCLSLMAPCVFYVPPESGERIGFGITIVLALSVYLLVISDKLPEKSDQSPLIGVLYTELFFLMIATLLTVVFTTHLAYKTTKPPRKLRHVLCNRCTTKQRKQKEVGAARKSEGGNMSDHNRLEMKEVGGEDNVGSTEYTMHRRTTFSRSISGIHKEFTFLSPEEEKEMQNQELWKEIAERIDRINFWVFLCLTFALPFVTTLIYLA